MKLKCNDHKRRVILGKKSFIHRNGDGSACDSLLASIGGETFSHRAATILRPPRSVK